MTTSCRCTSSRSSASILPSHLFSTYCLTSLTCTCCPCSHFRTLAPIPQLCSTPPDHLCSLRVTFSCCICSGCKECVREARQRKCQHLSLARASLSSGVSSTPSSPSPLPLPFLPPLPPFCTIDMVSMSATTRRSTPNTLCRREAMPPEAPQSSATSARRAAVGRTMMRAET